MEKNRVMTRKPGSSLPSHLPLIDDGKLVIKTISTRQNDIGVQDLDEYDS